MRLPLNVLGLSLLLLAGSAHAQSGPVGFQSPSKNIACAYFDYDKQNTLRCDIMEATVTARRPADCDLEWGKAFEMRSRGSAVRLCYGDTVMDPKMPMLVYGEVWQRGGFTCTSEQSGVTCLNADRRGFSISRAKQDLF
ncbi:DUF6636 domain-containing protein [Bradyrhizobium sp. JYMT SZCCT0428]|uniref:DUF6636 domain-containing protein n=1 Tax=Bradyrhizobium sp. JYMT SZCCT0428 TaxID=2807673 RepID=UPI001BAE22D4|nr:DUF6636 domain-containing protein [Bradyrhizobium sp. JYMT SZCCT0428]MBR1156574.1 hypothetical protein [Bradyrhizobium sp. JYMT SZCCT0428]